MSEQNKTVSPYYDEFVERMLLALFELGLMPMSLGKKPSQFEKYPQQLLTLLRTTRDVDEAFAVWRSVVLRKAKTSKEAAYPKLAEFGRWLQKDEVRQIFESSSAIRHLRQSMYGRSFDYLYPRLALVYEYRKHCQQDAEAMTTVQKPSTSGESREFYRAVVDRDFVDRHFNGWTTVAQERIKEAYGEDAIEPLLEAAQDFLSQNPYWFNKVFSPKEEEA
jgi:hypothetical protein